MTNQKGVNENHMVMPENIASNFVSIPESRNISIEAKRQSFSRNMLMMDELSSNNILNSSPGF